MGDHNETPSMPLMMRLKFFTCSFMFNRCLRSDGTINRRLLNLLDLKIPPAAAGSTPVSSSDISVDPSRDLWFRLFVPLSSTADHKLPLIIYFHGGGFSCFSPDSKACDVFCLALAARIRVVVASVNYAWRRSTSGPSNTRTAFDALKFINDANYDVLPSNTDLDRCFLAGDSAGGNIAHHVAVRAGRDRDALDKLKIAGLVAVQPFFGGEKRTEPEVRLARAPVLKAKGENMERVRRLEFPGALVVVGGFDPLQDWQRRYAQGLKQCGKQVELVRVSCSSSHGFHKQNIKVEIASKFNKILFLLQSIDWRKTLQLALYLSLL